MSEAKKLKALASPPANAIAPVTLAIASAVKALHDGTASSHQQQLALQWIVREACGKAYFPYHASDRDTAFALGRSFVGEQIVGLFNADLSSLRRQDVHETSTRTAPTR
jgi:hypothetical protein